MKLFENSRFFLDRSQWLRLSIKDTELASSIEEVEGMPYQRVAALRA